MSDDAGERSRMTDASRSEGAERLDRLPAGSRSSRRAVWAVAFIAWTAIGLFEAIPYYIDSIATGQAIAWWYAAARVLPRWYLWALLTPAVVLLARRAPLEDRLWAKLAGVYLPASVLFTAAHLGAWLVLRSIFFPPADGTILQLGVSYLVGYFAIDMVAFWAILGGFHVFRYIQSQRLGELERARLELRASLLEALLSETRLHVLTAQLRPHFLFNTLNTIAGLAGPDPERAEQMTVRLSELLRLVLERTDVVEVPLADELRLIEAYLAIERVRLGDRMTFDVDIEPAAQDARVPTLLLQPLVENAVRHGIAPSIRPGRVDISARRRTDGMLRIEVRDDGVGVASNGSRRREGVGLRTTRMRLEQLYGGRATLRLDPLAPRGTRVTIELPFAVFRAVAPDEEASSAAGPLADPRTEPARAD